MWFYFNNRLTGRFTVRQTERKTERKTERQIHRQTNRPEAQTEGQPCSQTDRLLGWDYRVIPLPTPLQVGV
jgi:hypothetical protein